MFVPAASVCKANQGWKMYSVRIQTLENKWAANSAPGPKFEGESEVPTHLTKYFFLTNHKRGICQHSTIHHIASLWLVRLNCAFYPCETPHNAPKLRPETPTYTFLESEFLHYRLNFYLVYYIVYKPSDFPAASHWPEHVEISAVSFFFFCFAMGQNCHIFSTIATLVSLKSVSLLVSHVTELSLDQTALNSLYHCVQSDGSLACAWFYFWKTAEIKRLSDQTRLYYFVDILKSSGKSRIHKMWKPLNRVPQYNEVFNRDTIRPDIWVPTRPDKWVSIRPLTPDLGFANDLYKVTLVNLTEKVGWRNILSLG